MGCISEDDLLEYLDRRLAPEDVAAAEAHLRGCSGCRQALAALAGPEAPTEEGEPAHRYEVLAPIGAGGMGVIYAARDRMLHRTVALKMLQSGGAGEVSEARMRERLLREARAMARLSHPNVLAVYEVGELEGQVFLAMERVEGETLTAWLRQGRRSWREVVEVFLDAARGLSAAHSAGLIHRDFKPDNVLVGADGRVRVTDFGLASALAPIAGEGAEGGSRAAGSLSVTALAGSPPYMAPEQLRGETVDARADVFGYCVSLYEALYGERPFRGESLAELEGEVRRGEVHAPRRGNHVPGWLRRVVLRGLRHEPEQRFQSMEAVILALEGGRGRVRRRVVGGVAVLAALVVLSSLGPWRGRLTGRGSAAGIRSLAVLPLQDLSGDPSQPLFAETITEALTTDLGRTQGLRVTSRHSANAFKATQRPLAEIGRELKVDALLEGSIRRSGNHVRVDLQMIRAQGGEQVWAGRFDGDARDGFALEDQASRAVRAALALSPSENAHSPARPTSSSEAFDLYLAGKVHLRRENEKDQAQAVRLLERAVAIDPRFAEAQAALSHAYGLRASQFAPGDTAAVERAEVAARKALQLDPDLAEAHHATAYLLWGVLPDRFMHERAVQELKRALALNPNLSDAHHFLGVVYLHIGLLDEAMAELQKTVLLDPTDSNAVRRIALVLAFRGEYEEAVRTLRQVPQQSNPSYWHYDVAWTLQYLGRTQEARALMDEYLRAHPDDRGGVVTSARAMLFAKEGDERRAKSDIAAAVEKGKGFIHFHHTAYNVASAYALLGDPDHAVRWLRVTAETGWPCYPLFAADPNLVRIRQDPGFIAFMDNLKAQWERYRATLAP